MDKIFAKLLTEALAPVVALLTEIRDQRAVNQIPLTMSADIQTSGNLMLTAPAGQQPATPTPIVNTSPVTPGLPPAVPVSFTPAAEPISRQALGEALTEVAKLNRDKAWAIIHSFAKEDGAVATSLNDIQKPEYGKLEAFILAAHRELSAPTQAAGLL